MLGVKDPINWRYNKNDDTIIIEIPDDLQTEINRPCEHAYIFKIQM
jgi:hypothetical protein